MAICSKKRFPDKISAEFQLIHFRRKRVMLDQAIRQWPVRAYQCDRCDGWHVTAQPEQGVKSSIGPKGKKWEKTHAKKGN